MPAVDTSDRDTTCGATTPPTADAVAADNSAAILPMSDAADDTKDGATSEEERDIQDGCQSSAERNIWSVFNPIWNIFVVNKARLPSRRDRGADWAGTAGRPEELHTFLGTKNPVNRKVPSKAQTSLLALIEGAASGGFSSQGGTGDSGGGGDSGAEGAGGGSSAGVRMMLTTRDASKLTAALRKCVKPYKVELVDEVDGVKIFLSILQRENVGYELLAVKAIFRMHWPDLQRCIAVANEVFCEKQFLSEENTLKVIAPRTLAAREERSHHVQASDALEPLDPCHACTLRPPCQHISEQKRIARLHRLLKAGAAAVERAVAAKASFEAGDGNPPRGWAQGTTDVRSPPPSSQRPESRLTPVPGAVSTNKSPKQLKPSTFGSRANKANSRGVEAVIAKLGKIGADLEAERAWAVDDREPGGGMHEFRASVFDKKMERLSRRCEDAHEEADAVSEAYILLAERVR
eukprot:g16360.t1